MHFKKGFEDLNKRLSKLERNKMFLQIKGKQGTFEDMVMEKPKLLV